MLISLKKKKESFFWFNNVKMFPLDPTYTVGSHWPTSTPGWESLS